MEGFSSEGPCPAQRRHHHRTSRHKLGFTLPPSDRESLLGLSLAAQADACPQETFTRQVSGSTAYTANTSHSSDDASGQSCATSASATRDRGLAGCLRWYARVMTSGRFNVFMGLMVTVNMITMGIELDTHPNADYSDTELSFAVYPDIPQAVFMTLEIFFFVVFSLELSMRVAIHRRRALRDASIYVDAISLLPLPLQYMFDLDEGKHLLLLRVIRLMKLFRLVRLIRSFKELQFLVKSIFSAMRTLIWIGLLLVLALYCAAIACTMLIGHNEDFGAGDPQVAAYQAQHGLGMDARRYWGSVARSMVTLFQIFTLDNWSLVVRPIVETHQPWMLFFFVAFIFATSFGLLNLLMGAIVDHTMSIAREAEMERERLFKADHKRAVLAAARLFTLIDCDRNGKLTSEEIVSFLSVHDMREVLEKDMASFNLKVDYADLGEIFQSIVEDWLSSDDLREDGDGISMEEFAGAALRMQGPAKSKDLLSVLITSKSTALRVEAIDRNLRDLHAKVAAQGRMMQEGFGELRSSLAARGHWDLQLPETPGLSPAGEPPHSPPEVPAHRRHSPPGSPRLGQDEARDDTPSRRGDRRKSSHNRSPSPGPRPGSPKWKPWESRDEDQQGELVDSPKLNPFKNERRSLRKSGSRGLTAVIASIRGDNMYSNTEMAHALEPYCGQQRRASCAPSVSSVNSTASSRQGSKSSKDRREQDKAAPRRSTSSVSINSLDSTASSKSKPSKDRRERDAACAPEERDEKQETWTSSSHSGSRDADASPLGASRATATAAEHPAEHHAGGFARRRTRSDRSSKSVEGSSGTTLPNFIAECEECLAE